MSHLKKYLALLVVVLTSPEIMAHAGPHTESGFFTVLPHYLTSADHWLLLLVACLIIVLFLPVHRQR